MKHPALGSLPKSLKSHRPGWGSLRVPRGGAIMPNEKKVLGLENRFKEGFESDRENILKGNELPRSNLRGIRPTLCD
jgi:hypothetical protein